MMNILNDNVVFMAGLPRSGSTLLCNILAQNPNFHVTPTNGLINLVASVKANDLCVKDKYAWHTDALFRAQGLGEIKPRISNMIHGLICGFYEKELAAGKVVFDKNRGWITEIGLLEEAFGRPIKIIYPIRSLTEIVASFEKLFRQCPLLNKSFEPHALYADQQSMEGRARNILRVHDPTGLAVTRLIDILNPLKEKYRDRIFFVHYDRLLDEPDLVMTELHKFIGSPVYKYDFDNIKQLVLENDLYHNWEWDTLHAIKEGKLTIGAKNNWQQYIKQETIDYIKKEYSEYENLTCYFRNNFYYNA